MLVNRIGISCIRVINMKKTEYITFRTAPEVKEALEKIAEDKKWTISFVVEEIIKDWLQHNEDGSASL